MWRKGEGGVEEKIGSVSKEVTRRGGGKGRRGEVSLKV